MPLNTSCQLQKHKPRVSKTTDQRTKLTNQPQKNHKTGEWRTSGTRKRRKKEPRKPPPFINIGTQTQSQKNSLIPNCTIINYNYTMISAIPKPSFLGQKDKKTMGKTELAICSHVIKYYPAKMIKSQQTRRTKTSHQTTSLGRTYFIRTRSVGW